MPIKKTIAVYKKEIKETLRDKRTLFSMILFPILIMPLISILMILLFSLGQNNLNAQKAVIGLHNSVDNKMRQMIEESGKFTIKTLSGVIIKSKSEECDVRIEIKTVNSIKKIIVYYDMANDKAVNSISKLEEILKKYKRTALESEIQKAGLSKSILDIYEIENINTAPPEKMGGKFMGMIIPLILLGGLISGAIYPAIDLTAGEKERGTMETIFSLPVSRKELLYGKLLTVTSISMISGLLNIISMGTMYYLVSISSKEISEVIGMSISAATMGVLIAVILTLAVFISALVMTVCIMARSFKEAQSMVTPITMIVIFSGYGTMAPGIEANNFIMTIPVINTAFLIKEIFLGVFNWGNIGIVVISNIMYSIIAIFVFAKLFSSDRVIFSQGRDFRLTLNRKKIDSREYFDVGDALLIFAVIFMAAMIAGIKFTKEYGIYGTIMTHIAAILIPTAVIIWYFKGNYKTILSIRNPGAKGIIFTVFIWIGTFLFTVAVSNVQSMIFPETLKAGEDLTKMIMEKGVIVAFIAAVLIPPISEELLFRGVIFSSFKNSINYKWAMFFSALLFSIMHLDPYRLGTTFILGLALAFVVYKTKSIFSGMLFHFINNLTAVAVAGYGQKYFERAEVSVEATAVMGIVGVMVLSLTYYFYLKFTKKTAEV